MSSPGKLRGPGKNTSAPRQRVRFVAVRAGEKGIVIPWFAATRAGGGADNVKGGGGDDLIFGGGGNDLLIGGQEEDLMRGKRKVALDQVATVGRIKTSQGGVNDRWHGPFESGSGVHFLRVRERHESVNPPYEEIRNWVENDWQLFMSRKRIDEALAEMAANYIINVEPAPDTTP